MAIDHLQIYHIEKVRYNGPTSSSAPRKNQRSVHLGCSGRCSASILVWWATSPSSPGQTARARPHVDLGAPKRDVNVG